MFQGQEGLCDLQISGRPCWTSMRQGRQKINNNYQKSPKPPLTCSKDWRCKSDISTPWNRSASLSEIFFPAGIILRMFFFFQIFYFFSNFRPVVYLVHHTQKYINKTKRHGPNSLVYKFRRTQIPIGIPPFTHACGGPKFRWTFHAVTQAYAIRCFSL